MSYYEPEPTRRCPFSSGRLKRIWEAQIAEGRSREKEERRAAKAARSGQQSRDA